MVSGLARPPVGIHPAPASPPATEQGQAFGLVIEADFEVPDLAPVSAPRSSRRTSLELATNAAVDQTWGDGKATMVLERRDAAGGPGMAIEQATDLGYRVSAPDHGAFIVSPDGARISCALDGLVVPKWQRLLFAQVLPLAA